MQVRSLELDLSHCCKVMRRLSRWSLRRLFTVVIVFRLHWRCRFFSALDQNHSLARGQNVLDMNGLLFGRGEHCADCRLGQRGLIRFSGVMSLSSGAGCSNWWSFWGIFFSNKVQNMKNQKYYYNLKIVDPGHKLVRLGMFSYVALQNGFLFNSEQEPQELWKIVLVFEMYDFIVSIRTQK